MTDHPPSELVSPATFQFDRRLLDDFPSMVWFDNAEGHLVYANAAALEFTGREAADEVGLGWLDVVHPADRDSYLATYGAAREALGFFEIEYRLRRHDGVYRWVLDRARPMLDDAGELLGYIGFTDDTTERREIDAARRDVEEQVRVLGLATLDWVWSWDARTGRVVHNAAFAEALGDASGPRATTQAWWQERVHPEDSVRVMEAFAAALCGGRTDVSSEYRILTLDGGYAHIEDRACFVRDERGHVVRVLGAMRDITQRKRVEETAVRFTKILESTSDFVAMASAGGLVLHINGAGRELLGWPQNKVVPGAHLGEIHPPWAAEIVFEIGIPTAIAEGTWTGETALLTLDKREIPVSQVIISHRNARGDLEFLSTIIRDISERKREEVARIEWANRYDAAIRASGQVLFDWNSNTNEITYGGDLVQLVGFDAAEMAGGLDRLRALIHADDLVAFDDEVGRVIATRDPFRAQFRAHHKSGRTVHIGANGYFFIDRLGQIGRMVGFLSDVTSQQLAEQQLALAQEDLEARVADRTIELALANELIQQRALQTSIVAQLGQLALAGVGPDVLLGDTASLVRETLRVDFVSILELTPDGSQLTAVAESGWPSPGAISVNIGKASQSGYTLLAGAPVIVEDLATELRFTPSQSALESGVTSGVSVVIESDKRPHGVLIALTVARRSFIQDDVNFLQSMANVLTAAIDRKRAEERIRTAQEEAEGANRAKSEFLSRMSHELRTPLNAILGFSQLLEIDQPTPSQVESIAHISRAGAHLLALINEVLDIARIETGRLTFATESVELGAFVRETAALLAPAAASRQIGWTIDTDPARPLYITADRQRLKQVVTNLLSNSVKYNNPGGSVTVTCSDHGSFHRFSVTDTGPGIAEDRLARLFVPFERLGAEASGVEGTGLGLALSRRIVSAFGGTLGVESIVGEGTTFWVDLPAAHHPSVEDEPAPEHPISREATPAVAKRTVLYIEDQDLNLRLVERILTSRPGYRLISAMQGRFALDLAREHRPDIILLDLNLPDIRGDEILRRLRADPELSATPVIMVSADAMGDRVEELLSLGATGYLTKPYKLHEFFRVIESALAGAAAHAGDS
ncbi:MAG: PAS domain-containing protein [Chthoniobacteraceae bacterium]